MLISTAVPLLSALLLAIIVGVATRNLGWLPSATDVGLRLNLFLRLGVVLLGLRLSIPAVLDLGLAALGIIVATVVVTYLVTLTCGRLLGLPRQASVLIATGCAICGAAAVAAVSSVLPQRNDDELEQVEEAAATAVATVTLFGTVALLVVPPCAALIGLGTARTGIWIGSSIHEVGQVVAAAGLAGAGVTTTAVLTKLGRVVLLAPLVAIVAWYENRSAARDPGATSRVPFMPWFVAGFVAMILVRSVVTLPTAVLDYADLIATFFLTMGMFAMGAGVHLRRLWSTGGRAMSLGAAAGLVSAAVSLVLVIVSPI